jgi:hypothetical protein
MVMKTKLFITGLILIAFTTIASAQQGRGSGACRNGSGRDMGYGNRNCSGVCNNTGTGQAKSQNRQVTGAGNRNGNKRGTGQNSGKNYVDSNQNSVCDNYETRAK